MSECFFFVAINGPVILKSELELHWAHRKDILFLTDRRAGESHDDTHG